MPGDAFTQYLESPLLSPSQTGGSDAWRGEICSSLILGSVGKFQNAVGLALLS